MKKLSFYLISCILLFSCSEEKGKSVKLHLEGKNYKQVFLRYFLADDESGVIDGKKRGKNTWEFPVTDSIFNNSSVFRFGYLPIEETEIDPEIEVEYSLGFVTVYGGDTLEASMFVMEENQMEFSAKFLSHNTEEYANTETGLIDSRDETDRYFIPLKEGTEHEVIARNLVYGSFVDFTTMSYIEYDEGLNGYIEVAKEWPNSKHLMVRLNNSKGNFRNKKDLESIYNEFSEENRNSVWGQSIFNHLNTYYGKNNFDNIVLPHWDTGEPEKIVEDLSKNTLIVFSASWCGPCTAQIPLLKEIYQDLKGDNFEIVYVSMDEEETVADWKKEMKDHVIPWRSVSTADCVNDIWEKYNIAGIPHALLYDAKDGKCEVIDVRLDENKKKLYELIKGS